MARHLGFDLTKQLALTDSAGFGTHRLGGQFKQKTRQQESGELGDDGSGLEHSTAFEFSDAVCIFGIRSCFGQPNS